MRERLRDGLPFAGGWPLGLLTDGKMGASLPAALPSGTVSTVTGTESLDVILTRRGSDRVPACCGCGAMVETPQVYRWMLHVDKKNGVLVAV